MHSASHDLLVIGAGHLGGRVARAWAAEQPAARVLAETRSAAKHDDLCRAGVDVRRRQEQDPPQATNLLFSVSASAPDYSAEAERAARLWNGRGRLVMTSSTAVYAESNGGTCNEVSALAGSERASRLLAAEEPIRAAGGIIVRLAGLYDLDRGPHRVFLRTETSPRRPDGLLNLLHYDDAASLCVRALTRGRPGSIYLGCDDGPLTRQALVDAAVGSGLFPDSVPCTFTGEGGPIGRRCNNAQTRRLLAWQPSYSDFDLWLDARLAAATMRT